MRVRPLVAEDLPAARRVWAQLGGWYRETTPVADQDLEPALAEALRSTNPRRWRWRRGGRASAAWIVVEDSSPSAWIYARTEPEQSYVVPLVPASSAEAATVTALAELASAWFRDRAIPRFLVEIPEDRAAAWRYLSDHGERLWTRTVLHRDVSDSDRFPLPTPVVRDFRPADLRYVRAMAAGRRAGGDPVPVPVPFLNLRAGSWIPGPRESRLAVRVWVAELPGGVEGVVGATCRPGATLGFVGPWLLGDEHGVEVGPPLLRAATAWLSARGMRRVRTSLADPETVEAAVLESVGFRPVARSGLVEVEV
jgi:hypothetical protein